MQAWSITLSVFPVPDSDFSIVMIAMYFECIDFDVVVDVYRYCM